jgi:hypothetical protein
VVEIDIFYKHYMKAWLISSSQIVSLSFMRVHIVMTMCNSMQLRSKNVFDKVLFYKMFSVICRL